MTRPGTTRVGPAGAAVRQGSLREHNLALVLRHVAEPAGTDDPTPVGMGVGRAPSRADLATRTGLTRATVSALVDDLITGGLVREVEPAPRAGAGRPAAGLVLADDGPAGLGLEINVDYLAACVVDLTGALRHREVRRVDLRPVPAAEALARVADLADSARREAARRGLPLAGTALAVPGLVTSAGIVRLAPNLGWHDVDVPAALGHPDPAPLVDNEANLAALGELHAGSAGHNFPHAGSAGHNFLYVSGEIGIGAGIVLDGALFRGARGWSGELGHVPVRPDGVACRCGGQGCLERYAGQEAILAAAGLTDPALPADRAIARLADLAGRGDPDAKAALTAAGTALGVAVAGVINLLDIETVVLGGVYAPLARWLTPPVEAEVRRRVLTAAWSPVTVRPAVLGGDAAVLGAAGSVVRTVLEHPARWLGLGALAAAQRALPDCPA